MLGRQGDLEQLPRGRDPVERLGGQRLGRSGVEPPVGVAGNRRQGEAPRALDQLVEMLLLEVGKVVAEAREHVLLAFGEAGLELAVALHGLAFDGERVREEFLDAADGLPGHGATLLIPRWTAGHAGG